MVDQLFLSPPFPSFFFRGGCVLFVCVRVCVCVGGLIPHVCPPVLWIHDWVCVRVRLFVKTVVGPWMCARFVCRVLVHDAVCVCVCVRLCVVGPTRCRPQCCPRPGAATAGLGTRMRSESVRKGGSKSRSACCRYKKGS